MVGELMSKTWNLIKKESSGLYSNMKDTAHDAFYGPVGVFKNPIRFVFFAGLLGDAIETLSNQRSGHKAMDEDDA